MWTLRTVPAAEWPSLAGFVFQHNQRADGRVRCLHAEQGTSPAGQAAELAALPPGDACFIEALLAGERVGVIGAALNGEGTRAWVRGPLMASVGEADAARLQADLLAALHGALVGVDRFDAFPQADETALCDGFRGAGYHDLLRNHVMTALASAAPSSPVPGIAEIRDGASPIAVATAALHDRVFPDTYLGGGAMLASLDGTHRLFVATFDDEGAVAVAGYVYVQHPAGEAEGYVDFLGVDPGQRRGGTGRRLLAAAMHWATIEHGLPQVSLTVREDRAPALGLYLAAGFREVAAGAHLSFRRGGTGLV